MKRPEPRAWSALLLALAAGCTHGPTASGLFGKASPPSRPPPAIERRTEPVPQAANSVVQKTVATETEDDAPPDRRPSTLAEGGFLSERMTLCEAVEYGLLHNPRLRAALAAIDAAGGQQQVAFAPFLPRVDVLNRYVATSSTMSPGAPGPTGGILVDGRGPYDAWQSELQIQWTLYDFGRTGGRFGQAQMHRAVTELQARRMRETIAFEITASYLSALEAVAVRKIAEDSIWRAEAVLEDAQARRAAGVALRDDVLRIDVELAASRDALVQARQAELAAQARLNNGMGRNASLPLVLADEPGEQPFRAKLIDSLQQAIVSRPEVNIARDRVAAAQFGRQAARGEALPRLSARGSVGYVDGHKIMDGLQEGAGIHLDMPIYHGGQQRGEIRTAAAEIQQAAAESQSLLNEISLQVTLAHRESGFAYERIGLARPAVIQAEETLRIVRGRFRNGTATPTDVVDAENALTRAEQRYVSARLEYLAALARLAYATGQKPEYLCAPAPLPPSPEELPRPRPPAAERW